MKKLLLACLLQQGGQLRLLATGHYMLHTNTYQKELEAHYKMSYFPYKTQKN